MYILTIPLAHLSINIVTITCDTLKGRPSSSQSMSSDPEFCGYCLEECIDENRLDSPDSFTFHVKDQEIDVYLKSARLAIATKPLTYADVVRCNLKTTSSDVSIEEKMSDARSPSPEIYSSDNEDPQELLRNWVNELRPYSHLNLLHLKMSLDLFLLTLLFPNSYLITVSMMLSTQQIDHVLQYQQLQIGTIMTCVLNIYSKR